MQYYTLYMHSIIIVAFVIIIAQYILHIVLLQYVG